MPEISFVFFQSLEATDDDYEDFNEKHGYYPDFLHKVMITVS